MAGRASVSETLLSFTFYERCLLGFTIEHQFHIWLQSHFLIRFVYVFNLIRWLISSFTVAKDWNICCHFLIRFVYIWMEVNCVSQKKKKNLARQLKSIKKIVSHNTCYNDVKDNGQNGASFDIPTIGYSLQVSKRIPLQKAKPKESRATWYIWPWVAK